MIQTAILGAGAAGLFAALHLEDAHIFEHNPKPAQKIKISGGGRCNVTNEELSAERYRAGDEAFVEQVFKRYDNEKLLDFLAKKGCHPVLRKKGQYFCPHSSDELIQTFLKNLAHPIHTNYEVERVEKIAGGFKIVGNQDVLAKTVLIATGGLSYKKIGASGIGYEIAKSFGHEIAPLKPALVGLTVQKEQFWFKELSGISLKARVEVGKKRFYDDILFAHRGISGPAILNASLYWDKGPITIAFLERLPKLNSKKQISTLLPLPRRFVKAFLKSVGLEDKPGALLSKQELERLRMLCHYTFAPAGTFGYERAEVTKGGIMLGACDEDLQSRLQPGLFFAGEVLDVTGELGGYNFQWAFSSAYVAAQGIRKYLS